MKFTHLTSEAEIRKLIAYHNANSTHVVLDFETTDKDPRKAKLIDIQMSGEVKDTAVMFDGSFLPLLLELKSRLVLWNYKYDFKVAYLHGVDLREKFVHDGMLLDHLVDENREHNLDSHIQEKYKDDYKEKFWTKYKNYLEAPFEERLDYGCRDIVYTDRIYRSLLRAIRTHSIPDSLIDHVHRLARALLDTELEGIKVDLPYCIQMGSELKAEIIKTEQELRTLGGYHCDVIELQQWSKEIEKAWTPKGKKWMTLPKPEFNFSSSDQVARLLYDQLRLPAQFSKKSKNRTVDDKALEFLEGQHPIIPEIRKLRKYSKMYTAFIENTLEKVQESRIYPSFNVNGTVTGRISHSEPNMGQMPSKGDWAKIRGIFVPDPGHKLVTCDYSQLEVCIAAHFSMDKNLLKIIHEGVSKHDLTAEGVGLPRHIAKTLNFAMQYQCSPRKVMDIVGCSEKDAELIWNKYWETYAGEKKVIDECKAKVDRGEPIVNPFGRRRRFPTKFQAPWEKEAAYRQAYSSLIQGTGGDITSRAFYLIAEQMQVRNLGRAWFTIHDEVLAQPKEACVAEARELISSKMVAVGKEISLRIPLAVDCSEPLGRWQK